MPSSMGRVFNIKCLLSSFTEWVILTTSHLTLLLFLIWVWDKSKSPLPWSWVKDHSSLFTVCFLLFICSLNNFLSFFKLVSYFSTFTFSLVLVWSSSEFDCGFHFCLSFGSFRVVISFLFQISPLITFSISIYWVVFTYLFVL